MIHQFSITPSAFIYLFDREREREHISRGEGQREKEKQTPVEQGAQHGVRSQDPEIMT